MLKDAPKILTSLEGGILKVTPCGDIDHHTARILRDRIDAAVAEARPELLLLDLSGVDFMDSSGLGLVLGRQSRAAEYGAKTRLCGVSPRIMRIFTLAGADKLLDIQK